MENNKYYTPSLDEFHLGFLYEYKDSDNLDVWNLMSFAEDVLRFPHLNPYKNVTRVKYLDREDIESLGFEDTLLKHDTTTIFKSNYKTSKGQEVGLLYTYNSNWCLIFAGEFGKTEWKEGKNTYQVSGNLFAGFIKNKSELKKLLEQLNIQ